MIWVNRLFSLFLVFGVLLGGSACTKGARKARYLARADQDFKAERYDRAEIEYLGALRIAPSSAEAVSRLGVIYYRQGKFLQAFAYLQKGVQLQPENVESHAVLGRTFLALRGMKEARREAEWVMERQAGNEDALLMLGVTASTSNEVQETFGRLDKLPAAVKVKAAYHIARAELFLHGQELEQAEAELKEAVAADASSSIAYMTLGDVYLARGEVKQGEAALKKAVEIAPPRSPAALRYADFSLRNEAGERARELVEGVTKQAPDYVPAWVFLAQLAFAQQKYGDCEALIKTTLARDPVNLDVLTLRGTLLLAQGETTNAIEQFERILNIGLYKGNPRVRYLLALAQIQSGATARAGQTLRQILSDEPNFADAILLLANLNIRRGDAGSAVLSLTQLIRQQPQIAQAHLLLANAYLTQKSPDEAMTVYRRMEGLFPQSPEVPQLIGIVLAQQEKKVEARKAFGKSLEIAPGYLPALESLVDLDLQEKRYDSARGRVERRMQQDPKGAVPWLLMAKVSMAEAMGYAPEEAPVAAGPELKVASGNPAAQAELGRAESALSKAIALDPGLSTSYLFLARLYVASGKQQQALDRLGDFASKTNNVAVLMQIGMIQDELKHYEAAKDAYEKVLIENPRFSPALNNLAYLYSEHLGQLSKAYEMAEKARQLMPYDPLTADTLGWILYRRGEYSRALGLIEESAGKLPGEPEVQFHLGMTHYMLGEEEAASASLEGALRSNKDFPGKEGGKRCMEILGLDPRATNAATLSKLESRLKSVPNDAVAFSRLGAVQERTGAFQEASETYQQALRANPENPRLMIRLARIYGRQLGQGAKALELAKEAHSLAPEDPQVSHVLGELVYQAGDFTWTTSLLEESARKLPADPEVAYDLAWAYYSLGRVSDAEGKMKGAAQAGGKLWFSEDANRFLSMVAVAGDLNGAERSADDARRALERDPNYVPALMLCGVSQERQGNYQEAAKFYQRVLNRYPLFVPAMKGLAELNFAQLGDEQKAFEMASKARELSPGDPEVAKVLGMVAYGHGDFSRAAQLLEESGHKRTADAELQYYLGMALYRLKDNTRSKAALQRALDLNLRAQLADEAARAMKSIQ